MKRNIKIDANKPIGPQMRDFREQAEFTVRGLADKMGLSSSGSGISQIENGRIPDVRLSTLVSTLKAMGYKKVEIEL